MDKFTTVRLKDLGRIITGKTPPSSDPKSYGQEYLFITPSDNFDNKYIDKTNRYLSEYGKNLLKSKLLKEESVLVTCIGSAMGKVAMNSLPAITNQQINSIEVNELFNSHYIYYCLKNNYSLLRNASSGSTALPILNKTDFEELTLQLYRSLSTQKSIAHILSTLDQKIAINNQINAQLEQMAKTLYDYWFVQFDFPDENGKPYKSSGGEMVYNDTLKREIPKGWEVKSLGEIIKLSVGREDANFATENGEYPFFTCAEKNLKCDIFAFNTKAILLAGNGSFAVKRYEGKFNAYQRTYVLEPIEDILYPIVYLLVKANVEKFISGSRGSIIKFITKGDIENIQIALPKYLNFSEIINISLSHAETLEKQNQQLAQLRDFLLPMLMNGQVGVGDD